MKITLKCTYPTGTPAGTDKTGKAVKDTRKIHTAGDAIDLPKDEAERLIGLGHATAGVPATASAPARPKKPTGEALQADIVEAIGKLDRGEGSEDFTRDGKPVVAAIEKRLDYDITADERDHAWEAARAANPDLFN